MHMHTRRSFDGDIGARVPDLRGVLAVPAPAQHVVSSLEGARAHISSKNTHALYTLF